MFPDCWYMIGMSNLPSQSFQLPHLQPPMLGPLHHPNYAALLQGPHLWVPTITPFGPILVLQVVEIDVLALSDINLLQPLLPTLTAPPQVPTMRCPAPQATPSFCPWRPNKIVLFTIISLWPYTSIHCSYRLDAHKKDYGEATQHLGMERHFGKEFLLEKTKKNQNY